MYSITEQQVDFILRDLEAGGIETEALRYDLLDHICVIIEGGWKPTGISKHSTGGPSGVFTGRSSAR
ncbi:hypothetical protein ACQ86N_38880 [Puia sp. P3]|uniref:hypothetical protein n=1 Tax=Puia sp. P3 TaxID=3423952 RepID=UPI003D67E8C0